MSDSNIGRRRYFVLDSASLPPREVDLAEWGIWLGHNVSNPLRAIQTTVVQTGFDYEVTVETTFVGTDLNSAREAALLREGKPNDEPHIYESILTGPAWAGWQRETRTAATRDEALKCHAELVALLEQKLTT